MRDKCCCGIDSTAAVRIIATFDIFLAFAQLGSTIFAYQISEALSNVIEHNLAKEHDDFANAVLSFTEGDGSSGVVALIMLLIGVTTVDVVASFCLLYGISSLDPIYCRWWYRLRVGLLGLFIIYFFVEMSRYHLFLFGILDILKIFYRIYTLSTVSSYIRKLEKELRRRERHWNRLLTPSYPPVGTATQTDAEHCYPQYSSPFSPTSPLICRVEASYLNIQPCTSFMHSSNYGTSANIPPSLQSLY